MKTNICIDLKNTWCYATVQNHDKLRLLGYDHNPVGRCKDYYYIDNNNKIIDLDTKPEYKPKYREIVLNKQKEFEVTDGDKDHSEEMYIKVTGKEYVLTKEDQEYLYSKRPPSLPNTTKDQFSVEPECQFAKYGFEKPAFECELLKEVDGKVLGIVYIPVENDLVEPTAFWWHIDTGKLNKHYLNMYDLIPIKKPWYRYLANFPCLLTNGKDFVTLTEKDYNEWDGYYIGNGYRPATEEEAISLVVKD